MLKTTANLLSSVNRRAFWPSSGGPYDDADILAIATEDLQGALFTMLVDSSSELYTAEEDIALVASQVGYRIPAEAGWRLRDVLYIDSTGEQINLPQMPKDKLGVLSTTHVDRPQQFYMDGHKIGIWPKPGAGVTGSLRFKYFWQPNALVSGGTTIAGTTDPGVVTPAAAVTGWTTASGATWDVMADAGAHGRIEQFLGTYAATPNITSVTELDFDEVRIGDILAQTGETHVPQVPTELFEFLCQRTLVTCLTGHADKTVLQAQTGKLLRMEEDVRAYLEKPVQGESMVLVPDSGALRQM